MNSREILSRALALKPEERFAIVEGLLKSLDEPYRTIDEIWAEEAEKRLAAYRKGELEGIPMEEVFRNVP
uniref:addiction module protein n=1 Tax=Candidatus Electrothrix sp. TaxID=2170559 RepID=UPI004055B206